MSIGILVGPSVQIFGHTKLDTDALLESFYEGITNKLPSINELEISFTLAKFMASMLASGRAQCTITYMPHQWLTRWHWSTPPMPKK
eukprot:14109103-Ditylum_brightwellii.AAC.1